LSLRLGYFWISLLKARLHGKQAVVFELQAPELRPGGCIVQMDEGLSRLNDIAFLHQDGFYDAAFQMLDDLDLTAVEKKRLS
jgi:hypothetical protein